MEKGKLYWIPGTKIIGAASFQNANATCAAGVLKGESHILDNGGLNPPAHAAGRDGSMSMTMLPSLRPDSA